jgi:hypothetical protein
MASPNVKSANSCHLTGDCRLASVEAHMMNQQIVDRSKDRTGTEEPKPGCRIHRAREGLEKRKIAAAVTPSCPARMAYTRAVDRDNQVRI